MRLLRVLLEEALRDVEAHPSGSGWSESTWKELDRRVLLLTLRVSGGPRAEEVAQEVLLRLQEPDKLRAVMGAKSVRVRPSHGP